jgi:ribosomal protein L16 Arg81 hydroxylase
LQHRRRVRLGDFVNQVLAAGPSKDHYLTANNELLRQPEFASLLRDIGSLPDYCDASQPAHSGSSWFGPAGTVTPLHHDALMLFHTQVVGRKRWRFVSPLDTLKLYKYYDV